MDNKYNLQVGDTVEDITTRFERINTITAIEERGVFFNNNSMSDTWQYVNGNLDRGAFNIAHRAKKAFPEQWAFKAENINDAITFSDWVNSRKDDDPNLNGSTYTTTEIRNHYFHYPKYILHTSAIHTGSQVNEDYEEITFDQFKEHYLNEKPTMEKEIIGYNLKKEFEDKEKLIADILNTSPGLVNGKYWLPKLGIPYQIAVDMKVLDIWFEPVYKQSERKVSVGFPSKEITITNKKEIIFEGSNLKIEFAERLRTMFQGTTQYPYIVYPKRLWIGCSDGTEVTKEEVENIIGIYNELNP